MSAELQEVFAGFEERLKDLEKHVEEHDISRADPSEIPEFETKFFSLARDLLMDTFALAKGFTYEEASALIESSDRSAPLRMKGTKVANLLGSLEYAPDRSYHEIDDHLKQLDELIDLAKSEPKLKKVQEHKPSKLASIGHSIAKATSIFWFPFRWMVLSFNRKGHERKAERNETYLVEELLEAAREQLEKDRLEDAIKTYHRLVKAYDVLPSSLKTGVRDPIVRLHEDILKKYAALRESSVSAS